MCLFQRVKYVIDKEKSLISILHLTYIMPVYIGGFMQKLSLTDVLIRDTLIKTKKIYQIPDI